MAPLQFDAENPFLKAVKSIPDYIPVSVSVSADAFDLPERLKVGNNLGKSGFAETTYLAEFIKFHRRVVSDCPEHQNVGFGKPVV